jgi:hypothetical protein
MRIWKLASYAAAFVAGVVCLMFLYRIFRKEGPSAGGDRFGMFQDFLALEALVVLFVLGTVTFPYYWTRSVRFWWATRRGGMPLSKKELNQHRLGFAASCVCILLLFLVASLFTNMRVWQ